MSGEGLDIKHLAWLARIELTEEEAKELEERIRRARILIDRLLEAPVEGVEPLYHAAGTEGRLREDAPMPGLRREEALANAARSEKGFFVAPRTVEED